MESKVTFFQFTLTGNEIVRYQDFNLKSHSFQHFKTIDTKKLTAEIEELKNELERIYFTNEEQKVIAEIADFENQECEFQEKINAVVQENRHAITEDAYGGRGLPLGGYQDFAFEHDFKLKREFESFKKKQEKFEEGNYEILEVIEAKERRKKDVPRLIEEKEQRVKIKNNLREEISKDNNEYRISLDDIERLNKEIERMTSEGWKIKLTQPLTTGVFDSFGSTSHLGEYGGTVDPSGGYGCSFTSGMFIFWEK